MADTTSTVTVVGQGRQADVTLPSCVAVAELLPELVALLDGHPNGAHPPRRWSLLRVGGEALDGEGSLEGQGVLDGALLFLCDASAAPPPPVVEDVVEAVGSAVDARPGRWTAEASGRLLLGAAAVWSAGTGAAALAASPPGQRAAWTVAAGLALIVGAMAAQLAGQRLAGAVLALGALPSWAATGAALDASLPSGGALGAGGAAAVVAGAALGLGVGAVVAWLVAPTAANAAAAALLVAAPVAAVAIAGGLLGLGAGGESGVVAVAWLAIADRVPWLSARLAALSSLLRDVPGGGEGDPVAERVERAHRMMAWLLAAAGGALATAMVVLAGQGTVARLLCVGLTAAVALRTRSYRFTAEVMPLALAALAGAAVLSAGLAGDLRGAGPLAPLLLLTIVAAWTALALAVKWLAESSPRRRRSVDGLELAVNMALVPLVVAALGGFDLVAQMARHFS